MSFEHPMLGARFFRNCGQKVLQGAVLPCFRVRPLSPLLSCVVWRCGCEALLCIVCWLCQQRALSHGSVSTVSNRPLPNALPPRSADGCDAQASDYVAKVSRSRHGSPDGGLMQRMVARLIPLSVEDKAMHAWLHKVYSE